MRYLVLATDYDGTLANKGRLDQQTIAALERLRASGRQIILVTGRELADLQRVCPRLDLFAQVVAENGALLYNPVTRQQQVLGEPPPAAFIHALKARNITPLSIGRSIVATWHPNEHAILSIIRELGIELQVIFNKGAVMVLPAGVNKASGLKAALEAIRISAHNVVGIGDAENDHAFLHVCECSVAVANALTVLKDRADWVTQADHGAGVCELIDLLLHDDLASLEPQLQRHRLLLGTLPDGSQQWMSSYGPNLLISGSSGSGKSTFATALLDHLSDHGYQSCVIDPEGDYESYEQAVVLGDPNHEPTVEGVLALLANPTQNVVVNLLGMTLAQRPSFYEQLLPRLQELRSQTGRPHWIIVDEAHHMLHADRASGSLPSQPYSTIYITVHPTLMASPILATVDHVAIVGEGADTTLQDFCRAVGDPLPATVPSGLEPGELIFWRRFSESDPMRVRAARPTSEHRRHIRKYAEGDMHDDSFFFRGPGTQLNLRAQNLLVFLQIADGVDDQTWLYHLKRGDYTRWFQYAVKDAELAEEADQIAKNAALDPQASRAQMRAAIKRRYTAAAT